MILDPNGMPILQPAVDNAETATFNTAFAAVGTAFSGFTGTRQIQTFVWADNAARTAQTGMTAGDEGYQRDTKVAYRYDGAAWDEVYNTEDSGWVSPTISDGTPISGNLFAYRRIIAGGVAVVYLRGRINSLTNGVVMFTLPAGYRPSVLSGTDNVLNLDAARINFTPDGKITTISFTSSVTFTGVSFIAT